MMRMALAAAAAATILTGPANAAEVTLLCSNALKSVMDDLAPRFEKASGHKLSIVYGSTGALKARITLSSRPVSFSGRALDGGVKTGLQLRRQRCQGSCRTRDPDVRTYR